MLTKVNKKERQLFPVHFLLTHRGATAASGLQPANGLDSRHFLVPRVSLQSLTCVRLSAQQWKSSSIDATSFRGGRNVQKKNRTQYFSFIADPVSDVNKHKWKDEVSFFSSHCSIFKKHTVRSPFNLLLWSPAWCGKPRGENMIGATTLS